MLKFIIRIIGDSQFMTCLSLQEFYASQTKMNTRTYMMFPQAPHTDSAFSKATFDIRPDLGKQYPLRALSAVLCPSAYATGSGSSLRNPRAFLQLINSCAPRRVFAELVFP